MGEILFLMKYVCLYVLRLLLKYNKGLGFSSYGNHFHIRGGTKRKKRSPPDFNVDFNTARRLPFINRKSLSCTGVSIFQRCSGLSPGSVL